MGMLEISERGHERRQEGGIGRAIGNNGELEVSSRRYGNPLR